MTPIQPTRRGMLLAASAFGIGRSLRAQTSRLVHAGADGRLVYAADASGNRIPDFSNCGYGGGGAAIPEVAVRATVKPPGPSEDATGLIQEAIDRVARLAPDERGFRGAVLLARGRYAVGGSLRIAAGGVVLRGEGDGADGTVIVGTGKRQRSLIEVRGRPAMAGRSGAAVSAEYVAVGERSIPVASSGGLRRGQIVAVRRHGNAAWIREIGMDRIRPRPADPANTRQWQPFDLDFERRVEAVEAGRIVVDAPITCAIEKRWGGGEILPFDESGRIAHVGIENLRGDSEFDAAVRMTWRGQSYLADEQHCWTLISIGDANHAWVRGVTAVHFGYACVSVGRARHVTVRDCRNVEMVSEITGSRRYPFSLGGQLCLVEKCEADTGRHDWVVGARVCGPNVFLESKSGTVYATSEPHHRWSVGGLYDNVRAPIAIQDRQHYGTGHGWAGANYVVWNCEGPLVCQSPPTARNWAIGQVGKKEKGAFEPRPDGVWESFGRHVEPRSLYRKQLEDRLGR